jgi:magnesium-transporting ATPase (P-type)
VPAWRKFLAQFRGVLVILLLIATLISVGLWLSEHESALPYEAMAIFAVLLLNAVMGYIQSHERRKPWRRCARCRQRTPTARTPSRSCSPGYSATRTPTSSK